jgi:hypothetical protein
VMGSDTAVGFIVGPGGLLVTEDFEHGLRSAAQKRPIGSKPFLNDPWVASMPPMQS